MNRVYAVKDGKSGAFKIGKPLAEKVSVEALVLQTVRAPKVTVFKFKRKKHYKRTQGHRQLMSRFVVTKLDVALDEEDIAAASAAQSAPAPADE